MTSSESPTHPDAPRAGGETPTFNVPRLQQALGALAHDVDRDAERYALTNEILTAEMAFAGEIRELAARDGDYDEMVCAWNDEPAHRACRDAVNAVQTSANPPSVPSLDVAACVRLLTTLASELQAHAESVLMTAEGAAAYAAEAAQARALASALPGMGKDSEDMDWLEANVGGSVSAVIAHRYRGLGLAVLSVRDAINAARASQPEETSADAE